MSPLQTVKFALIDHLGLAKDALHIYVGLILFFGSMLVMRWKPAAWKPLLLVTVAAITGEIWDLRDSRTYGTPIALAHNWHDIWNTLFWPAAIFALARWTSLFSPVRTPAQAGTSQSDRP